METLRPLNAGKDDMAKAKKKSKKAKKATARAIAASQKKQAARAKKEAAKQERQAKAAAKRAAKAEAKARKKAAPKPKKKKAAKKKVAKRTAKRGSPARVGLVGMAGYKHAGKGQRMTAAIRTPVLRCPPGKEAMMITRARAKRSKKTGRVRVHLAHLGRCVPIMGR